MTQGAKTRSTSQRQVRSKGTTDLNAQLRIKCPSCGKALTVPSSAIGRQGTCPGCKNKITIESPVENRQATTPPPSKSEPEIIEAELIQQPSPNNRILTESANELIDVYKWAWHRGQAVFLCGSAVLVFLTGLAFIFEQPRLRNIPGGIMMVVGSFVVFAGGVWIWRRRCADFKLARSDVRRASNLQ